MVEAWPLDTEKKGRAAHQDDASLASSIFLVGRKREKGSSVGDYGTSVRPELEDTVRERVRVLWENDIVGADLVIAAVGAGLRAFTKYDRVEYANGEPVLVETFLAEVEGVVLDTLLERISGEVGQRVSSADPPTRFYVLWRYVYGAGAVEAGEAIVFTWAQHVEIDGPGSLSEGKNALVRKRKSKYELRDFRRRGAAGELGVPDQTGRPAPVIDVLHRVLYLMENAPAKLPEYLDEARPDRERLRLVAQALAGPGLSGGEDEKAREVATTPAEQAAIGKLLANWQNLVEGQLASVEEGLFGGAVSDGGS